MIFFENILGNGAVSKLKFLDKVGDPPHKTARRPRLYKPPDIVQLKNALTFSNAEAALRSKIDRLSFCRRRYGRVFDRRGFFRRENRFRP